MKASRVQPALTPTEDTPNLSWDWMCVKERAQLIDDGDCSSVIVKTQ